MDRDNNFVTGVRIVQVFSRLLLHMIFARLFLRECAWTMFSKGQCEGKKISSFSRPNRRDGAWRHEKTPFLSRAM